MYKIILKYKLYYLNKAFDYFGYLSDLDYSFCFFLIIFFEKKKEEIPVLSKIKTYV